MTVSDRTVAVPSVDGLTVALAAQVVLLAVLTAGVGIGPVGWLAGSTYAVVMYLAVRHALHASGAHVLGPANQVTLARATLVGGVLALVADSVGHQVPVVALVSLASVALVLDAVDGKVARRTGTTSALGARFDMEVDAFLALVLSAFVAQSMGWWVLAIGAFRYVFVAAGWVLPWLRGPVPPRFSRKIVAAVQGVVLVVASAGILPPHLAVSTVGVALALLCWSFGRDVDWLWRSRQDSAAALS